MLDGGQYVGQHLGGCAAGHHDDRQARRRPHQVGVRPVDQRSERDATASLDGVARVVGVQVGAPGAARRGVGGEVAGTGQQRTRPSGAGPAR